MSNYKAIEMNLVKQDLFHTIKESGEVLKGTELFLKGLNANGKEVKASLTTWSQPNWELGSVLTIAVSSVEDTYTNEKTGKIETLNWIRLKGKVLKVKKPEMKQEDKAINWMSQFVA